MAKAKKPRTAKQLANDERLRNSGKVVAPATPETPNTEEDFTPTVVVEKQLEAEAKAAADGLAAPVPLEGAETTEVLPEDNKPSSTAPQPAPFDMAQVTAIAIAVAEALRQNPQIATATPEQKLEELESAAPQATARQHTARLGAGGEVQGVVFRYEVSKDYYPDPTGRLLSEPKLSRFAMSENFILRWNVDGVEFKKNNITYSEPRFTLELYRKIYDENGEPTGTAALVARQMQHEDEFTTRMMAMRQGILANFEDSEEGFRALMSEIRYQRFQQWLFSIFTPPKITSFRRRPTTQVIDGKVVEVFDTESLIDHDTGVAQASTLRSQDGVGSVAVPQV